MSVVDVTPEGVEILRRARERISTPERWGKGYFAQDEKGQPMGANPLGWRSEDCLCIDGAVMHARCQMTLFGTHGAGLCLSIVAKSRGFETASKFNDAPETTHADAMSLFDEAIALAESMLLGPS